MEGVDHHHHHHHESPTLVASSLGVIPQPQPQREQPIPGVTVTMDHDHSEASLPGAPPLPTAMEQQAEEAAVSGGHAHGEVVGSVGVDVTLHAEPTNPIPMESMAAPTEAPAPAEASSLPADFPVVPVSQLQPEGVNLQPTPLPLQQSMEPHQQQLLQPTLEEHDQAQLQSPIPQDTNLEQQHGDGEMLAGSGLVVAEQEEEHLVAAPAGSTFIDIGDIKSPELRIKQWAREKPRSTISKIWQFGFSKYTENKLPEIVVCDLCAASEDYHNCEVKYGKSKTTTCLMQHLRHHHTEKWKEYLTDQQMSKSAQRNAKDLLHGFVGPWDSLVCRMIVEGTVPLDVVTNPVFEATVIALNKKQKLPTVEVVVNKLLANQQRRVQAIIDAIMCGNCEALSAHGWTSEEGRAYYSIIRHCIDKEWRLHSLPLMTVEHDLSASREWLTGVVDAAIQERSLDCIAVVCDAAEAQVQVQGASLPRRPWTRCLDGCLQEAAEVCLGQPGVGDALGVASAIATFFRGSARASAALENLCTEFGRAFSPVLAYKPGNGWESTFRFVERLMLLQPALHAYPDMPKAKLTDEQWKILGTLEGLLTPLMLERSRPGLSQGVTGSLLIPVVESIRSSLKQLLASTVEEEVKCTLEGMLKVISDRWSEVELGLSLSESVDVPRKGSYELVHIYATALDPRTKSLRDLPLQDHRAVWDAVTQAAFQITAQDSNYAALNDGMDTIAPPQGASSPNKRKFSSLLYDDEEAAQHALGQTESLNPEARRKAAITSEVTEFIKLPSLKLRAGAVRLRVDIENLDNQGQDESSDPLDWWRAHETAFPMLAKLAQRVLCLPATTLPGRPHSSHSQLDINVIAKIEFLRDAWSVADEWVRQHPEVEINQIEETSAHVLKGGTHVEGNSANAAEEDSDRRGTKRKNKSSRT
jgi:hypothetical protein